MRIAKRPVPTHKPVQETRQALPTTTVLAVNKGRLFQMPGLGGGYIAEHRWADAARAKSAQLAWRPPQ